ALNCRALPAAPADAAPPAVAPAPRAVATAPPVAQRAAAADARPWRVTIDKARLEEVAMTFLDQSRAAPLEVNVGDLAIDLSAKLETGPAGLAGAVEGVHIKIARGAVSAAAAAKTRLFALDQIRLEGGRIDLRARQIAVSRVGVTGGATTLLRAADGSLPLAAMLGRAEPPTSARPAAAGPARAAPAPPTADAKPWIVSVSKLDLGDHRVT